VAVKAARDDLRVERPAVAETAGGADDQGLCGLLALAVPKPSPHGAVH